MNSRQFALPHPLLTHTDTPLLLPFPAPPVSLPPAACSSAALPRPLSLVCCLAYPIPFALQLPEGASKNFTFAWVCDAKGGLYLSVNKEHMITCGTGTIDLTQTLKIQGAKPVSNSSDC